MRIVIINPGTGTPYNWTFILKKSRIIKRREKGDITMKIMRRSIKLAPNLSIRPTYFFLLPLPDSLMVLLSNITSPSI
jgi:hypothetical protein